ncbi:unnamed protein product [Cyprideis torosa]|uniref:Uncharacterized protein n=1 Tax=Cyprideis torosa TaxID=163714 RepID=A0A7R8W6L8_9CRUS|nr:unnamed protein product [Cyprideis torosa]CAG0884220.1 unnamed protein product [Cyprideis torosa]
MDACRAALAVLSDEKSTINGVAAALRVMEDDGITNAGLGSNLTHSGTVECEAAVMETCSGMSGCVGAVSGVKNPSEVAVALLRGQQDGLLSLGRLPPSFIVGDGARKWAIDHGITVTGESDLITASAHKSWLNWTSKLQKTASSGNGVSAAPSESSPHSKRRRTHDGNDDEISDTVGVICVVGESIAVGASSGGILVREMALLAESPESEAEPHSKRMRREEQRRPAPNRPAPTRSYANQPASVLMKNMIASLSNLGNTCFLNSVLYVLRFTPGFREELHRIVALLQMKRKQKNSSTASLSHHHSLPNGILSSSATNGTLSDGPLSFDGNRATLIIQLHELFKALHVSEKNNAADDGHEPLQFIRTLRTTSNGYESGEQQDAHEFLLYLLDQFRMAENTAARVPSPMPPASVSTSGKSGRRSPLSFSSKHQNGGGPEPLPPPKKGVLSGGTLVMETQCLECENKTQIQEEFMDITVPIPAEDEEFDREDEGVGGESAALLMNSICTTEILQETEKYWCTFCHRLNEARRSVIYSVLPDVLVLHLKRFSAHPQGSAALLPAKVSSFLPTPLMLPCFCLRCKGKDLPNGTSKHRPPCLPFELYGVIFHQGASTVSGHYVTLIRLEDRRGCSRVNTVTKSHHHTGSFQKFFSRSKESSSCCEGQSCCGVCQTFPDKRSPSPGQSSVSSSSTNSSSPISLMTSPLWVKCDDHIITPYSEHQVVDALREDSPLGTPYVLFYARAAANGVNLSPKFETLRMSSSNSASASTASSTLPTINTNSRRL